VSFCVYTGVVFEGWKHHSKEKRDSTSGLLQPPAELRTGQTGPWPLLALENFEGSLASLIKNGIKMQRP
jgi:hypothetical protein